MARGMLLANLGCAIMADWTARGALPVGGCVCVPAFTRTLHPSPSHSVSLWQLWQGKLPRPFAWASTSSGSTGHERFTLR
jgi:DNA-binding transcriptional LysR family regulator